MIKWLTRQYHKAYWKNLNRYLQNEEDSNKIFVEMFRYWPYIKDGWYSLDNRGLVATIELHNGDQIQGIGRTNEERVMEAGEKYLDWLANKWGIEK